MAGTWNWLSQWITYSTYKQFVILNCAVHANCIPANSHALGVSCLWVENFDLTPVHACRPISHAWFKNVSCCRLARHNFQKYVNSDPRKEQKPCVKWINDNIFLMISDFFKWKALGASSHLYAFLRLGLRNARPVSAFVTDRRLRKTLEFFGNIRKWLCGFLKSQDSQD